MYKIVKTDKHYVIYKNGVELFKCSISNDYKKIKKLCGGKK